MKKSSLHLLTAGSLLFGSWLLFHFSACSPDDASCRTQEQCLREGRCSASNGVCVAGSDQDCLQSRFCLSLGLCHEQKGHCIAASDDDCKRSSQCKDSGFCLAYEGNCVAPTGPVCRQSQSCSKEGRCFLSPQKDSCIALRLEDCEKSTQCKDAARCQLSNGSCVSCSQTVACKREGWCQAGASRCEAKTNKDCLSSNACKAEGRCSASQGQCVRGADSEPAEEATSNEPGASDAGASEQDPKDVAPEPVVCRESKLCKLSGLCSQGSAGCVALYDRDCQDSQLCQHERKCRASGGICVTCSETPECKERGWCSLHALGCRVRSDQDCAGSEACEQEGACSFSSLHGVCEPRKESDCQRSQLCRTLGRCRLVRGSCVACSNTPECLKEGKCLWAQTRCVKSTSEAGENSQKEPFQEVPTNDGGTPEVPETQPDQPISPKLGDCSKDGWCWQSPFPNGTLSALNIRTVWGVSPNQLYAAGSYSLQGSYKGAMMVFDGKSWSNLKMVDKSTSREVDLSSISLHGMWGCSTHVFVVGEKGTILRMDLNKGLFEKQHFDASKGTLYAVHGTSCSNVYAVGASGLVMHYDGTRWKALPGFHTTFRAVWVRLASGSSSSYEVFAVGEQGTLIFFNGALWNSIAIATETLTGLWGDGTSLYVVGENGTLLSHTSQGWTSVKTGIRDNLYGIWGSSSNHIFAVGNVGTLLYYNGKKWSTLQSPTSRNLLAVWGSGSTHAVAVNGDGQVIRYDGSIWLSVNSFVTSYNLHDVWGTSARNVYAVGDVGTILHFNGTSWSRMSSGTLSRCTSIWGSGPNNIYVLAEETLLRYDGRSWSKVSYSKQRYLLEDVWGSGSANVYVLGTDKKYPYPRVQLHFNGSFWSLAPSLSGRKLWGSGAYDIFSVFQHSIYHFPHSSGLKWSSMYSQSSYLFEDVWGSGANDVYAVGWLLRDGKRLQGSVSHFDGGGWKEVNLDYQLRRVIPSFANFVWTVAFRPDGKQFAIGERSRAVKVYDFASIQPNGLLPTPVIEFSETTPDPIHGDIFSVAFHPNGNLLAAAEGDAKGKDSSRVMLWDLTQKKRIRAWQPHGAYSKAVVFHPNGKLLISSGGGKDVKVWDIQKLQQQSGTPQPVQSLPTLLWGEVSFLAIRTDGKWLACAHKYTKSIELWEWMGSSFVRQKTLQASSAVRAIAWSRDGRLLAGASSNGDVTMWDTSSWKPTRVIKHASEPRSLAFHPGGHSLAVGVQSNQVAIWDLSSYKQRYALRTYGSIAGLAYHPKGEALVSGSEQGRSVRVWGVSSPIRGLLHIKGRNGNDIYASGLQGQLLHYDGKYWRAQESGALQHLNAVWVSPKGAAFAVGERGTILYRAKPKP